MFLFSATWDPMELIEETQKPEYFKSQENPSLGFCYLRKIQAAKEEKKKKPETKDIKFSSNSFSASLQHGSLLSKWMKPKQQKYLKNLNKIQAWTSAT